MNDILVDEIESEILEPFSNIDPVEYLRRSLQDGEEWPSALLRAMAYWTVPEERIGDRDYRYFIGGEAFDWLLLAERLCDEVGDLIPQHEKEDLLLWGKLPAYFDRTQFKELIGVHKHRAYLNFYYGVTVEEALQLASEKEVHKRHLSNGNKYQTDFSEEAFSRVYRESRDSLIDEFCKEMGYPNLENMTLAQSNEFTYWLFKYRMKTADKAKIASDTRKGLQQLQEVLNIRQYTPMMG